MGDVPVVVFIGPVIAVAAMMFWLVAGKKMMAATDRRYSEFRVGELAQQMGLQIIEGDPAMNVMQAHVTHNMRQGAPTGGRVRRFMGDEAKETRIHMQGAPYGRPTEFVFYSYTELADRVAVVFVTSEFQFRLSVQVPVELPAFEIVNRKGMVGIKPKAEWGLPSQSFGDRDLDRRLALTCADPRLGPHLAPVVGGLVSHRYVHVQGHRGVIQSLAIENAVMYVVMDLVETQQVLEHMANALAGPVRPR